MINDEFVTRISYVVQGLDKLRGAARALAGFRRDNEKMATTAKAKMAVVGSAFDRASKKSDTLVVATGKVSKAGSRLAPVLANVARVALALSAGIGAVATAGAASGFVLVRLAGQAAKARQEMQLLAQSQGTKANYAEQLGGLYRVLGMADGEKLGGKTLEALSGKLTEARADPDAAKPFTDNKIARTGKGGKPRDTTAIALDVLKKIAELGEKERDPKLKESARSALAKRVDELGELVGLKGGELQRVRNQTPGSITEAKDRAAALFPARSDAEEAESAARAERWNKISLDLAAVVEGITTQLGRLRDWLAGWAEGPVAEMARRVKEGAQRMEIIGTTVDQRKALDAGEATKTRAAIERLKTSRSNIEKLPASGMRDSQIETLNGSIRALEERLHQVLPKVDAPFPPDRPKDAPAAAPEKQSSMIDKLNSELAGAGSKIAASFEAGTSGQRNYENIGNDQRTQSVAVTVNATGLNEVAALVARATASSLVKGSTASTAAAGVGP